MNTLYIFGNGFDLNLDLKTDYLSYLNSLLKEKDVKLPTKQLQNKIFEEKENWSDFEYALGKYTTLIKSEKDFVQLYSDIIETLAKHLENEEKKLKSYTIDISKIKNHLNNPISIIPIIEGRIKNELSNFRGSFNTNHVFNIMTFNYTKSVEHIFGSNSNINLTTSRKITSIQHVHGDLKNRMILGVNDESQIQNTAFKKNQNVTSRFIKNQVNQISGDLTFESCNSLISKSNLIILFGVSIGVTDKIWWKKIHNRLKSDKCKLLIFHYQNKQYDSRIPAEKLQIQEEIKERIIGESNDKSNIIDFVKNNIYVIVNGPFLQNIYNQKNN